MVSLENNASFIWGHPSELALGPGIRPNIIAKGQKSRPGQVRGASVKYWYWVEPPSAELEQRIG
jgi:hypothetical protein